MVQFIMLCYGPGWFHIKTKPNLIHSPDHVLTSVTSYRKLPESTQKIVKPYIASNAYHANPEHILLSMLCSDDPQLREAAVQQILNLRAGSQSSSQGSLGHPRHSHHRTHRLGTGNYHRAPPHFSRFPCCISFIFVTLILVNEIQIQIQISKYENKSQLSRAIF